MESGCFVPVSRSSSCRGFSRNRRRAFANAVGSSAVECRIALGGAGAVPDRPRSPSARVQVPAQRRRVVPVLDARADAVHEHREFLDVLRAIGEALPCSVTAGVVRPARECGERNAADTARQQELEGVDGVADDGLLVHAIAQPVERLANQARERERRVERAAEVGALDRRAARVHPRHATCNRAARACRAKGAVARKRALQRRERPVLCQRRRRGDEPCRQVGEDLAGPHAIRSDLVGDDEPAGAGSGRCAEHVHLRQARQRDDVVAPFGACEGRIDEPSEVVEPLVHRVVQDVAAVLHCHAHQLLDQRARVDTPCGVVRVVEDQRGDSAAAEQRVQLPAGRAGIRARRSAARRLSCLRVR